MYGVCEDSSTFCQLHVKVARGRFVRALVQRLAYWCGSSPWRVKVLTFVSTVRQELIDVGCSRHSFADMVLDSETNQLAIRHTNNPLVEVDIKIIKHHGLIVKYVLEHSGYILIPLLFSSHRFEEELKALSGCAIMVSVQQSYYFSFDMGLQIDLFYREPNSSAPRVSHMSIVHTAPTSIVFTLSLLVKFKTYWPNHSGLKISFSILSEKEHPVKLVGSLFNCSLSHYAKFKDLVHCNLKSECEDGRDETEHCPFSSPGCQGLVASRNKCFKLIFQRMLSAIPLMAYSCQMMGGNLASLKNRQEQKDSLHIFEKCSEFRASVGYYSGWGSVPFAYSKSERWSDNTIIYNIEHFKLIRPYSPSRLVKSRNLRAMVLSFLTEIVYVVASAVLCEIELQALTVFPSHLLSTPASGPMFILTSTWQLLTVCPVYHVTHLFLSCDPESHCLKTDSQSCVFSHVSNVQTAKSYHLEKTISYTHIMFKCDDDFTAIPYTLACDFRQDCPDTSDETFCEHPSCQGFLCSNGQCVLQNQRCNEFSDCVDDSDEMDCRKTDGGLCAYCAQTRHLQAPVVFINLDGTGYFTQQLMKAEESCPSTHYRCIAEWLYCLPAYTRCNDFADCVYGEDEQNCYPLTFLCPGLYQCRASTVCVHVDHLCDGWSQCPQRDDELMCDRICPQGCLCQGHSFLCHNRFSAELFPQLRYLDATGSGMLPSDFSSNVYLIHLSLSNCSLVNASSMKFVNLQFIDLSKNHLQLLDITVLPATANLRNLLLTNNPLNQMTHKLMKHVHYALKLLDLSGTRLGTLTSELSLFLPQAEHLNISFSATNTIKSTVFRNMPQLTELDMRGNAVYNLPVDLFSGSKHLRKIYSSNYRLCCEYVFPMQFRKINCFAPKIMLRSCTKLMPTEMHRAFFSFVSVTAILGNIICFVATFAVKKSLGNNFVRTVAQLEFAYVCMGGHVGISVIANEVFDETYIQSEKMWTSSLACKVSGFLSLLSSEVSVFIIWVITLDHIIVLCFPGDSHRLKQHSAACMVTWLVGILLSAIPFFPGLLHWGLHGQSGLCRLAIFDHYNSHQQFRWFTVIVAINSIVCSMVVAGQFVIYRRTPAYRITLHPANRWIYSSVHLMGKVASTDTVSWIIFGVVTLMTKTGVTDAETIHDAMAMFLLPLSSALNPFLYMWTLASLSRGQAQEEKLLEWLKSRSAVSGPNKNPK